MEIRRELHLILDYVTTNECDTEEKELVRMIFERACAPARDTQYEEYCEEDYSDDLDD